MYLGINYDIYLVTGKPIGKIGFHTTSVHIRLPAWTVELFFILSLKQLLETFKEFVENSIR